MELKNEMRNPITNSLFPQLGEQGSIPSSMNLKNTIYRITPTIVT